MLVFAKITNWIALAISVVALGALYRLNPNRELFVSFLALTPYVAALLIYRGGAGNVAKAITVCLNALFVLPYLIGAIILFKNPGYSAFAGLFMLVLFVCPGLLNIYLIFGQLGPKKAQPLSAKSIV